mmetsp:Transcript_40184/g.62852  ORF Transcript_40184/g.62852 Transcript_40184/m.62852 type:complete len:218 (-) Transcript_40184:248-901(-)
MAGQGPRQAQRAGARQQEDGLRERPALAVAAAARGHPAEPADQDAEDPVLHVRHVPEQRGRAPRAGGPRRRGGGGRRAARGPRAHAPGRRRVLPPPRGAGHRRAAAPGRGLPGGCRHLRGPGGGRRGRHQEQGRNWRSWVTRPFLGKGSQYPSGPQLRLDAGPSGGCRARPARGARGQRAPSFGGFGRGGRPRPFWAGRGSGPQVAGLHRKGFAQWV